MVFIEEEEEEEDATALIVKIETKNREDQRGKYMFLNIQRNIA